LSEDDLLKLLAHPSEHIRGWAVRLLGEANGRSEKALAALARLAKEGPSPRVRLQLASMLQRLAPGERWAIAEGLVAHAEDAQDAYLPLMTWYGMEPLVTADPTRALALARACATGMHRRYIARRLIVEPGGANRIVRVLEQSGDAALQVSLLQGMHDALRGRKEPPRPDGWERAFRALSQSTDPGVREESLLVGLIYDDPKAMASLRGTLMDLTADLPARQMALRALAEKRVAGLAHELQMLLGDAALRAPALRALAAYDDGATPKLILERYRALNAAERDDAVNTLAARPAYALALLNAVAEGTVPAREVSVTTVRQLQALGDARINELVAKNWGTVRPTARDKVALIARYKAQLTPDRLSAADRAQGRQVFQRACAQCHRMFDAGGDVGPDLTGSDRANLDYILENVLDPSASVGRDFRLNTVATRDGRILSGIVRDQSEATLTIQTVNERLTLDRGEIEELKPSTASMMPEGLFEKLTSDEVRDLVGYLGARAQVPIATDAR
jgi:putative heme-binding domain-containing protein